MMSAVPITFSLPPTLCVCLLRGMQRSRIDGCHNELLCLSLFVTGSGKRPLNKSQPVYIYKPFRPSFGDPCREVYVMDGQLFALAFKSELAIVAFCVP